SSPRLPANGWPTPTMAGTTRGPRTSRARSAPPTTAGHADAARQAAYRHSLRMPLRTRGRHSDELECLGQAGYPDSLATGYILAEWRRKATDSTAQESVRFLSVRAHNRDY